VNGPSEAQKSFHFIGETVRVKGMQRGSSDRAGIQSRDDGGSDGENDPPGKGVPTRNTGLTSLNIGPKGGGVGSDADPGSEDHTIPWGRLEGRVTKSISGGGQGWASKECGFLGIPRQQKKRHKIT